MMHWLTPTWDPDELQRRIDEMRVVHLWLEQSAHTLELTIRGLELQHKMLKGMQP